MLKIIARVVLAVWGGLALFVAANVIMDPVRIGGQLGVAPVGDLGLSTMRADLGSLFAGAGLFMLATALFGDRRLLIAPLVFATVALGTRIGSAVLIGYVPQLAQPMAIEGITIAVMLAAYAILARD